VSADPLGQGSAPVSTTGASAQPEPAASHREPTGRYLAGLTLGALGIVYGDIGTSPLYALKECFHGHHLQPTPANVLGVLSLIFWALILVISVKYLVFVLRADNRGEGGILSLMALALRKARVSGDQRKRAALVALGLFGAALLYGDGVITPAISVLSAVEGLEVATPIFTPYILPLTLAIITTLFLAQRRGTAGIGKVFGPITILWFLVLAALGLREIVSAPFVLASVNPAHGFSFFLRNGTLGFLVLGSVFLVVTGGEALYADMGHFGRRPIRLAWFWLVLPALLLNYFGQGALLLRDPSAVSNPFYRSAPEWALYPLVALAAAATVIASQAVISGAFSLTRQAMQLGYIPRVEIVHTSDKEIGQIYVPVVNWLMMFAVWALVLGFKSSSNIAAAYGIAVTSTMVITTLLFFVVAREQWLWTRWVAGGFAAVSLVMDLGFFGANVLKIADGGWFPVTLAAVIFIAMATWKRGRAILAERMRRASLPLEDFLASAGESRMLRVPGAAVFMTSNPEGVPPALLHNLKHNKALHQRVVLLTIGNQDVPYVPPAERVTVAPLDHGFYRLIARYGYMEDPSVPDLLKQARSQGLELRMMDTTFFLGRETIIPSKHPGMALWREHLFAWMSKNARPATSFFKLPPNRVVELGAQIEI